MIKNIIKKLLEKKGYVNRNLLKNSKLKHGFLYLLLFTLQKNNYKIIQIGANDGEAGDPINAFIKDYNNKITYCGFEPQEIPFNKLKKNYQNYKNFYLFKKAVGEKMISNFYYQKTGDIWKNNYNVIYGMNNSLVKENLSRRIIEQNLNPDDYIGSYEVEVLPLKECIETNSKDILKLFNNIDLLQIDAEGYDDQVIYNSSIDFFKPQFINFESKNLSGDKLSNLVKFLKENYYECIKWNHSDHLAVLTDD